MTEERCALMMASLGYESETKCAEQNDEVPKRRGEARARAKGAEGPPLMSAPLVLIDLCVRSIEDHRGRREWKMKQMIHMKKKKIDPAKRL
jgi:hypothetical protein